MTILQMRCFVSLADTRKLTETANLLNLRVSTLSKYIAHMEDEFSGKLFRKSQNGLVLTKEGELIYPSMQFIVKKRDELMLHMNRITHMTQTTLDVALAFHQAETLRSLIGFSKRFPDIGLTITETPSSDIRALLDAQSIDVAIVYEELLMKKYHHMFPVRPDRLVAVVGHGHRLAERRSISLTELTDDTFFLFKGDPQMHRFQIRSCIAAGFTPTESPHDFRVNTILEYVALNRGVSLLIDSAVRNLGSSGVVALALRENPALTLSMVFPAAYLPDTCDRLIRFFKEEQEK